MPTEQNGSKSCNSEEKENWNPVPVLFTLPIGSPKVSQDRSLDYGNLENYINV